MAQNRECAWTCECHSAPAHPKELHDLGGPNTAELSQMQQNIVTIQSAGRRSSESSPVVQASRARCGLLVLVVGISLLSQNRWGARRMRQPHKKDALQHVTAGAGSASLSATSPVVSLAAAAGVSSASSWRGRLPHPSTRRHS